MLKLVVLLVLLAIAAAKPSGVYHETLVSTPVVTSHVLPSSVSHQTRTDVVSSPIIERSFYSAPIVAEAAIRTPVGYHEPIVHAAPSAVSHQYRTDVISKPSIAYTAYSTPVIAEADVVEAAPVVHTLPAASVLTAEVEVVETAPVVHTLPAAVSHQSRTDIVSNPVVQHTEVAVPVVSKAIVAPIVSAAIGHQSRVNFVNTPAVAYTEIHAPTAIETPVVETRTYGAPALVNQGYLGVGHLGYTSHWGNYGWGPHYY